jgi:hypothetical protein
MVRLAQTLGCMQYRYELPARLSAQASLLEEFANGATQCNARLQDGAVHAGLLLSDAKAIIAMRGHSSLPFEIESIAQLFQESEDRNPIQRGNWHYFDSPD